MNFKRSLANLPVGVSVEKAEYLPLYAEWITPAEAESNKAILYFHGNEFVMDHASSHRCIVGNFVKMVGYKALLFDYHPSPGFLPSTAVNESAAIYQWMLEQGFQPEDVIFAGDSSGGEIEIGTLLKLKDDNVPLPAACVAFSPSLGLTISDNLSGLPPIMIHVGNDEVVMENSTQFGEKADSFGVDIRVKVWKGMSHCFPLQSPMFAEAAEAMEQVTAFIRYHIHKKNNMALTFLYSLLFI